MLPFPFLDSMLMFFFYGLVGWIVEVIYYGVTEGRFINRGFLNGPLCPVYGLGFYGVIWFFRPFLNNFPVLFFGSAIVATTVELLAGVILYKIFHLRWWDYSEYRFNLNGFICLRFSIYWGIACSLGMYMLHPAVMRVLSMFNNTGRLILVLILSATLIFDIVISVAVIIGLNKKIQRLDTISSVIKKPSDYVGERIYNTVDTIVTAAEPAVEGYEEYRTLTKIHRAEEKALADKHHKQEHELLMRLVSEGKQSVTESVLDSTGKIKSKAQEYLAQGNVILKNSERELLHRLSVGKNDLNKRKIYIMKAFIGDKVKEGINYENDDSI